jgi:RNA polymerase sigma factor (sigma-70 family)
MMEPMAPTAEVKTLLAHARWMEALAACLVRQTHEVDDVLQDTWVAVVRRPPDAGRPPRPWLGEVLRNVVRMRSRAFVRRRRHEEAAGREAPTSEEMPLDVLQRARLHQLVVDLVMALDEPYRSTVLSRFFVGCTPSQIAERNQVPAGTVRWRLNEAIRRLRVELDRRHDGDRPRWRALLAPLATPLAGARGAASVAAGATHPFVWATGLLAVLAAGSLWLQWPRRPADRPDRSDLAAKTEQTTSKETDMRLQTNAARAAALMVALPALAATAAAADKPSKPSVEEAVALCTSVFERVWDCREQMADAYVAKATSEERKKLRKLALAEVVKDSADTDKQCAADNIMKDVDSFTSERVQKIRDCGKASSCQAYASCIIPVIREGRPLRGWERR